MKAKLIFTLSMAIALAPGLSIRALATDGDSPETIMESASMAIDEEDLDPSIEKLEAITREGLSADSLSRLHFLLGKAKYIKVITDIRACRREGTQGRSELQEHQIGPLRESLDHLKTSYELSPDSDWAPEALFAAAHIQDYGCLQRFEDAAEDYRILSEKYPDTAIGKEAARKYDSLRSRLDGQGHGKSQP